MEEFFEILSFVVESAWGILPLFLLSVSLGILVRALKLDGAIKSAFDARVGTAIVLATAVGAFSPFCSCTVVPVVAGLLIGGVPLAPVMAFWVASPTMDPEILALSAGFLGRHEGDGHRLVRRFPHPRRSGGPWEEPQRKLRL